MTLQHGVNVNIGLVAAPPPIDSPTVIGIVGTGTAGSPTAALNTPVAVHSLNDAREAFGSAGTLYEACRYIFQVTTIFVVGVRFNHELTNPVFVTALPAASGATLNDFVEFTAAATGLADAKDAADQDVTTASIGDQFVFDGTDWILQTSDRSRRFAVSAAMDALARSETATGHKPTLIAVPAETYNANDDGTANTIAAKAASIANTLDAIAWVDAANDSLAISQAWDAANGAPRLVGIPQRFITPEQANLSGAVFFAGQQAALDAEVGSVREGLDNKVLIHLSGVSPSYTFSYRHPSEAAVLTDDGGLMVAVRHEGVWRAWGGRVRFGSDDPRANYATQRILDNIENHIVDIVVTMIGSGVRAAFISRAVRAVQDYLDGRVAAGDITSATCTPDPTQNTPANLAAGRVYLDVDVQTTPQARLITLNLQIG